MDHSHMDHGHMDHGNMGHGGHQCKMNMIFTWSTQDLCIIFDWWHIHSSFTLFMSLLGVVILTAGYELVRELARRYEAGASQKIQSLPGVFFFRFLGFISHVVEALVGRRGGEVGWLSLWAKLRPSETKDTRDDGESSSLLWPGRTRGEAEQRSRMVKAAFYAVQVFYSFFIMLLFMTYNGWVMLAVAVGAFVGYLAFGNSTAAKSVACH
ncbi:copper transpport protein [Coniosporium tulheliwenetii]|uniref:Copper transpport protein n=1 Tax=Coniosporium tulheliwenetii TaxID=3383036 RepID=A0ACC2ZLE9_9PEZI|nr:copper transpport protein [Cladosporium sp. JES 115]